MGIRVNLVGALNFINNLDGVKYTSKNSAGELIAYEVSEQEAVKLLSEKSEFGAPYFLLAEGSDNLPGVEVFDDEINVEVEEPETVDEEKKTVKRAVKIGGKKTAVEV